MEESPTWGSLAQGSYIGKTSPQNGRPMEIKVERHRGGGKYRLHFKSVHRKFHMLWNSGQKQQFGDTLLFLESPGEAGGK